ncbi:hypothetical protein Q31b_32940 [Novipirellula aureliae]|uniref:Uncharacterized protein n=1 Tax=Novipirellula aureliae TaxID=2527966 RepID=A0A5C6DT90_9BACT|nr:hypothetical protein Q31b_32940 [Novipirellula aureliae]
MREAFLSKLVFQTFSGYVASQFKKMQTDIRGSGRVKWKHVIQAIRDRHHRGESLLRTKREDRVFYEPGKHWFRTWSAALEAAGHPTSKRESYTADQVLLRIIDLYEREKPITFASHGDDKLCRSAKKHIGGWRREVESLGLGNELRKSRTDRQVLEAIWVRRAEGHLLFRAYEEDPSRFRAASKHFGD